VTVTEERAPARAAGMQQGVSAAAPDAALDAARVARARAGDMAAARELYDAHAPRIHRLMHRFSGDADRAEDWTQDAFIRAFERLDQFRGQSAFGSWLHRIAVNVALNGLRVSRRTQRHEVAMDDDLPLPAPDARRLEPDVAERLHAAIDALPERHRAVFLMYDLEGYPHADIAAALGITEGNSKVVLLRARARLRTALAELKEDWR
jgi:RNA polymerase sigma-70 factor (ECF subfamily)